MLPTDPNKLFKVMKEKETEVLRLKAIVQEAKETNSPNKFYYNRELKKQIRFGGKLVEVYNNVVRKLNDERNHMIGLAKRREIDILSEMKDQIVDYHTQKGGKIEDDI